ncbi:probable ribonuclease 11 isoform X3 [Sturnira hondurensis]|uniref:probable ribonuclease 11 isoform X3 n=1 Tax=Sturnira hondurensis TaxID=192404 RepID=UPI00187A391B|nr:probable ribonuclease 11 isoform X3 [Sturnira hondurensis]
MYLQFYWIPIFLFPLTYFWFALISLFYATKLEIGGNSWYTSCTSSRETGNYCGVGTSWSLRRVGALCCLGRLFSEEATWEAGTGGGEQGLEVSRRCCKGRLCQWHFQTRIQRKLLWAQPGGTHEKPAGWNADVMSGAAAATWIVTGKPHFESEVRTLEHLADPGLATPGFLLHEKYSSIFLRLLFL